MAYRQLGSGENVILFIHDNLTSSFWWLPIIHLFDLAQFTLIFIDLRGCGLSTNNYKITSLYDFSSDINAFLEINQIQEVNLVGWSLGGGIAQYLANFYP